MPPTPTSSPPTNTTPPRQKAHPHTPAHDARPSPSQTTTSPTPPDVEPERYPPAARTPDDERLPAVATVDDHLHPLSSERFACSTVQPKRLPAHPHSPTRKSSAAHAHGPHIPRGTIMTSIEVTPQANGAIIHDWTAPKCPQQLIPYRRRAGE